jgi:hypothetical protein
VDSAVCGNGHCEEGEDVWSCPTDCSSAVCGNGICEAGETTAACGQDCYCGNGTCDSGENAGTCVLDCGSAVCGDGTCQPSESLALCPGDCFCGNGSCDQGEDESTCAQDCTADPVCGDGICNGTEDAVSCPGDCTADPVCGDGTCDAPLEDQSNCPEDCGSGCNDPICDLWLQCGCQTGQKCTIDGASNRDCLGAGTMAHGQICALDTDCVAGTICVGLSAQDLRCHQFCVSDTDCPGTGGGGVCIITLVDGNQDPIPGATMCTSDCNPASTSPVGCPTGWACHLQYVDENQDTIPDFFLTVCANDAGTGTGVGDCDNVTTFCAPGYWCYTTWGDCIRTCRMGMSDCQAGMTCLSYADPAIVGTTEYGYCQ